MVAKVEKPEDLSSEDSEVVEELPLPEKAETSKTKNVLAKLPGKSHWQRFQAWFVANKKLSIPLSVVVSLLLLLIMPFTRYPVAGLVIKKNFNIQVLDSKSNTPVSGATVSAGKASAQTDGNGQAKIRLSVGHKKLAITKKYYQDQEAKVVVPLLGQKNTPNVSFVATGRQVKITIVNIISKQPLSSVDIKFADLSAQTDKDGKALVVLPAGAASQKAELKLNGYNTAKDVVIKVSDQTVQENNVSLTPAGKIYFLSKLSGTIDVVKTNLDGTERQTVLAGTGKEEDTNTVLLANRDWKYLALLSRREGDKAKLYAIETANDKLITVDEGDATFSLTGWSNNRFVYQVYRNTVPEWQPKRVALKSYNADNGQLLILDQNDATGDQYNYAQEVFGGTYILGDTVAYIKYWSRYGSYYFDNLPGKQNGIYTIRNDGSNKKTGKTIEAQDINYVSSTIDKPDEIYITLYKKDGTKIYWEYVDGSVEVVDADKAPENSVYNTYLLSPSGKQTFWSETRDGKNTLFIGDVSGQNGKQIAVLSEFQTYGWYTDNYLLISKEGSELYAMPVTGPSDKTPPIKISDYHKPYASFSGYGGGYGGL